MAFAPPVSSPLSGGASTVYLLNPEVVLRVPRADLEHSASFERERLVISLARQAGVRTPALLAFGTLPWAPGKPYMLLERVHGVNLGQLGRPPGELPDTYRELGRDLARWHLRAAHEHDGLALLPRDEHPDPRVGLEALAEEGYLPSEMAEWLGAWLDRLAPQTAQPLVWRVVHGDARPTNVLVSERSGLYRALLDWGDAAWADPASEFALLPLRAVPFALEGYRELRPGVEAEVSEVRVLWYHLGWAVHALRRERSTERTWSAPPVGRLLELLRFFVGDVPPAWRTLRPPL
ncbi:hypothetical protein DAETH_14000 [Deinococcus aetherius]|uniref:Aminoglycoside phosphotransferase domain-containing protein n=1 Tax=Deinococcus aetherius TaxID=200252 RepID=A0ABM8ACI0_9DEIO|nr:phosphotransferase [Deinococcus aetherius]BDP41431.1 hypothetical protein DAETH_14000 [Deinococcus aetherius]